MSIKCFILVCEIVMHHVHHEVRNELTEASGSPITSGVDYHDLYDHVHQSSNMNLLPYNTNPLTCESNPIKWQF
ncbi:hypothetical protein Y032_0087g2007 [Ancylostoma ceylanicum]|uniref:Uncharacterized protein n=1 Tax=Ancylostoma ceylanicum TaxID=53326 RepID=A0A016TN71_9BILA|nr:hypothetical protein Y032_0087g2007 [Ancylostoma ceylanicum]